MFKFGDLEHPIVQAPMGGGPSTPELAVAVCEAGGLGFLPAGYRSPGDLAGEIERVRAATQRPFGVNVFAGPGPAGDPDAVSRYAAHLAGEGELGKPRHDDDEYGAKVELLAEL